MIGRHHLVRRAAPAAMLAAFAAIPTEALARFPVVCVWRTLLDLECPGCGMTRALSSVLHGHLYAAVAYNRGVVLMLPAVLILIIREAGLTWRRKVVLKNFWSAARDRTLDNLIKSRRKQVCRRSRRPDAWT